MDNGVIDINKMMHNAQEATVLLKSLANESRLMILCKLVGQEKSVSELMEIIPLSQSALSQHLSLLRRERIVKTRRNAQSIYYSIASNNAESLIRALYEIYCRKD